MSAFASHTDLEDRWRTLTAEEQGKADTLLAAASRYIRSEYPGIDDRIGVTIDPDTIIDVVCWMVRRVMLRRAAGREGVRQSSREVASVKVSETYDTATDGGGEDELYLTDRERSMLNPPSTRKGQPRWTC